MDFTIDSEYAPVAERISLFYKAYPAGRIITELISRTERDVVFKATVYRASEGEPAATGWAAEREGDGEINVIACLENTETSAIGRALANLGFTASRQRPSAEEMAKASRVRARVRAKLSSFEPRHAPDPGSDVERPIPHLASTRIGGRPTTSPEQHSSRDSEHQPESPLDYAKLDVLELLATAKRLGLSQERAASLAARVHSGISLRSIERLEAALRGWIRPRLHGGCV